MSTVQAGAVAPAVHTENKSTSRAQVLGQGEHTYELIDNWGKLPATHHFGNTHAIQETADGRIFVHHQGGSPDSVCVFDPDGKLIKSWGKEWIGGAHGMQLRREGNEEFLYLAATTQNVVLKTTLDGEVILKLDYPCEATAADGTPCYAEAKKYIPTNIAFHPTDGSFYVADGYGKNFVHQFSEKGKYIRTWGGTGTEAGQFKCPHGIWTDTRDPKNPMVLVADRGNVRLQWFTLDGKFIKMVSDELRHPCHFDQRGQDLLIPDLLGRVTIFDGQNKLVTHLGDNPNVKQRANNGTPKEELVPGQFCAPHGAIWDRAGNIYVGEWLKYGRITKLGRV